jgi:hypothetical protein
VKFRGRRPGQVLGLDGSFDNGDELVQACSRRHETSLKSKAAIRDRRRMILTTMRGTSGPMEGRITIWIDQSFLEQARNHLGTGS